MRLCEDRFVINARDEAFDVATTGRVRLRWLRPAGAATEMAWRERCAERFEQAERAGGRLLDYGMDTSGRRFEVTTWQAQTGPDGMVSEAVRLACEVVCREVADLLDGPSSPGPRRLQLQVTRPEALEELLRRVARLGRVRGFVPLSHRSLARWPWLQAVLLGRHVIAFEDEDAPGPTRSNSVSFLLALGLSSTRSHFVLVARRRPERAGLARAVELSGISHAPPAGGLRGGATAAQGVREASGRFGSSTADAASRAGVRRTGSPHAQVRRGIVAAGRGRGAAGVRLLRSAAGALSRRGDHHAAADAALVLGELLRESGRVDKAIAAFDAARASAEEGDLPALAARATVEIGLTRTDAGQLAAGEAAIRSAGAVAAAMGFDSSACLAGNALARCLLWQGRDQEVRELLRQSGAGALDRQSAIEARLRARLALTRRDLVAAGRHAAAALCQARTLADDRELAGAHELGAAVASHAGDLDGVRDHVACGLRSARAARSPVRAWRLRVTRLEALTRMRDGGARRQAARLARAGASSLPGLLRSRLERALLDAWPEAPAASRWRSNLRLMVRVHGARALTRSEIEVPRMEIVEGLIEVLGICQEGEDEPATLASVCRSVRDRLGALAVWLQAGPPAHQRLAADGRVGSGRSEIGARITDCGLAIPPASAPQGGLEAGAPVRDGGGIVAALVCRWASDRAPDPARVSALLATVAAACAPRVRLALDRLATPASARDGDELGLIGRSQAAIEIRRAVARAAPAPFPVLVAGESGCGKELVARAIHLAGPRRSRRFCALNCAALNDELIEAELFGHTRGAFSGALHERVGLFEDADGGSLFLDEVSELSPRAQAKLLRAVQEAEIRRVGENFSRPVDVRLIAATNRDLAADVSAGRFRQDLWYRLDVLRIGVPPLRARVEDIAVLARHFWEEATRRTGSRATLTPEVLAMLSRYDWPGNVRELQNVMAALAVTAPARGRVGPRWLPRPMAQAAGAGCDGTLEEARRMFERRYVRAALAREGGHQGRTAAVLGLSRQGFAKALVRLDIEKP